MDHKDNVRTNNFYKNLQLITNRENASKDKKGHSSKYVGVSLVKSVNKWRASIRIGLQQKHIGVFDNEIDAHNAYQDALREYLIKK